MPSDSERRDKSASSFRTDFLPRIAPFGCATLPLLLGLSVFLVFVVLVARSTPRAADAGFFQELFGILGGAFVLFCYYGLPLLFVSLLLVGAVGLVAGRAFGRKKHHAVEKELEGNGSSNRLD